MATEITREEFEEVVARNLHCPVQDLRAFPLVPIPCHCKHPDYNGWQMDLQRMSEFIVAVREQVQRFVKESRAGTGVVLPQAAQMEYVPPHTPPQVLALLSALLAPTNARQALAVAVLMGDDVAVLALTDRVKEELDNG